MMLPMVQANGDLRVAFLRQDSFDQLDYLGALADNLPIGSGEIESAHRYIVQKRLKLPGSWWCAANAEYMLALRLNRANQQWDNYCNQVRKAA